VPYVCDATAHLITKYTIPNIVALLEEVVAVGTLYLLPQTQHRSNRNRQGSGLSRHARRSSLFCRPQYHGRAKSASYQTRHNHVSSMLLDLRQGKPIEVEVMVGEVVRMAKAHNVPVPVSVPSDADLGLALMQPYLAR
jgi:2-dehydropantoate 2-reductase